MRGQDRGFFRGTAPRALWLVAVLLIAVAGVLSARVTDARARRDGLRAKVMRAEFLREVSRRPALVLGFRNAVADFAWLKAVQMAAEPRRAPEDYDAFHSILAAVTNLDPKLEAPYLFAAVILGEAPGHAGKALALLDRGTRALPKEWRLPFYAGYIHYFTLGDPVAGGKALDAASRIPGSPAYLPLLAARMYAEGMKPETAILYLEELLRQEGAGARRDALEDRLRMAYVERDIRLLERAVARFRGEVGRAPEGLPELVARGILASLPAEPHGGRYVITPAGEVRSDRVASRLRIFHR